MSVLNAKARDDLPASSFAGPDRSYPVPDASHAAVAKARAKQQLDAGKMTRAEYDAICAKADKVEGGGVAEAMHRTGKYGK